MLLRTEIPGSTTILGEVRGSWQSPTSHIPDEDDVSLAHVLLGVRAEEEVAATALLDDLEKTRLVNYDAQELLRCKLALPG